ncbi:MULTISPECIES: TetR/AcrR family transcriptional regulator [Lysobacter]|jgi:TetR/AcrR family transcriptional regulator of autoinduction and epiphytic fitness|uniref:TetR/AcrR family transcriptional regulator n=1 Tax=Lysobacter gummosus TaxID=262324 RepID=A0ABY3XDM7_9GAMM|nr:MULTISPECIES: TetR/AcrR family transcriptional regulator [Lysobacter]ALN94206.1 transcriptional regulator AefR [Lysobacter gummosus]UJB19127.1 TetR/AcrR family transcriptional regulator [Lysobacter capsici]UJQ27148.1 TetR/AcrR family transcriptional regulator [Lysobacter gummosus]UNP29617.1 TetR/AcrR family transcriptional regulator [Lysobacter gummosus]
MTAPAPRLTDRKRAAILEAAVAEFRQAGYDATSMDRVAASAGVSKRTVYNHFPSKDALFAQILQQLLQRAVASPELAYRPDRPLRPQLLELVQQKLRLLHDEDFIELVRVAIAAIIPSPERAQEMFARMGDKEEGLTVWIRAAAADGRLKTQDPRFASMLLQGMIKGFAFWPQITMGQPVLTAAQRDQVANTATDMFLAHFAAE